MSNPDPEWLAARAMLLTAIASIAEPPVVRLFRLGAQSTEILDIEAMTEALRNLPKPVACRVTPDGDVLTIECRTVADVNGEDADSVLAGGFSMLRQVPPGPVLVTAGGAEVILPPEAVQIWRDSYRMSSPYSMSGTVPSDEQARRGIVWVLGASEGAEVLRLDEIDEPLRSMLEEELRFLQASLRPPE